MPPLTHAVLRCGVPSLQKRAEDLAAELARVQQALKEVQEESERALQARSASGAKESEAIADKYKAREEKLKKMASEQYEEMKRAYEAKMAEQRTQLEAQIAGLEARVQDSGKAKGAMKAQARAIRTNIAGCRKIMTDSKKLVQTTMAELGPMFADATRQIARRVQGFADSYSGIVENYRKEQKERKRLFNLVQELRGNIRVFCRVRPLLGDEVSRGDPVCASFPADGEIAVTNSRRQRKVWEFDQVFQPGTTNETVFSDIAPLLTSVLDGYNVCIFAYGQTGSGKTVRLERVCRVVHMPSQLCLYSPSPGVGFCTVQFTMEGGGTPETRGMNYRALDALFALRDERAVDTRFEVNITLLEIYNEEIRDMLRAPSADAAKLQVKEGKDGMYVPGLTEVPVNSAAEVLATMRQGYKNRTTFATDMNEHSSRSHWYVWVCSGLFLHPHCCFLTWPRCAFAVCCPCT